MKEKAPAHFARNDGRREGGCRGMEEGTMCCVSTREQDGHDVSCPYKSRKKRGAGKTGGRRGACWLRNGVVSLDSRT